MSVPIIFVGNLTPATSAPVIGRLFERYGDVANARLQIRDGVSRGFGYVEMSTNEAAQQAIRGLNGHVVDGRPIRVEFANNQVAARSALDSEAGSEAPPRSAPRESRGPGSFGPYRPTGSRRQATARPAPLTRTPDERVPPSTAPAPQRRNRRQQQRTRRNPPVDPQQMAGIYPFPFMMPDPATTQEYFTQMQAIASEVRKLHEEFERYRRQAQTAPAPSPATTTTSSRQKQPKQPQQKRQPRQQRTRRQARTTRPPQQPISELPTLSTTVHVGGVPTSLTLEQFREVFRDVALKDVRLSTDRFNTSRNGGFGYLDFHTPAEQQTFLETHATVNIQGRECRVQPAIDHDKIREQRAAARTTAPPPAGGN